MMIRILTTLLMMFKMKTKIIFLKGGAASKERKQGGCEVELKKVK